MAHTIFLVAPGQGLLGSGAALFLFSGLLLAPRLFVWLGEAGRRFLGLALWPSHSVGQAILVPGSFGFWA